MSPLQLLWLFPISASCAHAVIIWRIGEQRAAGDPSRRRGYRRIAVGYAIVGTLPWLVVGMGVLTGQLRLGPELLQSWRGNPFVVGALATFAGVWLLLTYWLFLGGGAEFLAQHPGTPLTPPILGKDGPSPGLIKALWLLGATGAGVALAGLWLISSPLQIPPPPRQVSDGYVLVYDASRVWVQDWMMLLVPLFMLVIALGVVIWYRRNPNPEREDWKAYVAVVGLGLFVVLSVTSNLSAHAKAVEALQLGHYQPVEGRVTNFVPMPWEGHANETFDVAGHHYEYSDFEVTPGFRQSRSHGGPIREGLQVRIADVGGRIFRLEIAR